MKPPDKAALWQAFKRDRSQKARDALIQAYYYLAKITAGKFRLAGIPQIEGEDLVGAGTVGLIKAVDQFAPERGVQFETYAIALIRGAILEMLREDDWVPRSLREKAKRLESAYVSMETRLGRPATEEEIAAELELQPEALHKMLADMGRISLMSLEEVIVGNEGNEKLILEDVIAHKGLTPHEEAELEARREAINKAIDRLPERERLVLTLYYRKHATFKEIGLLLKRSESRVYQLHDQATQRLRQYLNADEELML